MWGLRCGTGDSSDDDAAPLDMGDDVSGDDADDDDDDEDDDEDDTEAEPLDEDDESAVLVPSSSAAAGLASSPPLLSSSNPASPLRDRRVSSGSGQRNGRASRASGSSRASSPALALGDEDDVEGDNGSEEDFDESEAEALSDGEEDVRQQPRDVSSEAPEETWQFVGISRRSVFDTKNQTRFDAHAAETLPHSDSSCVTRAQGHPRRHHMSVCTAAASAPCCRG